MLNPSVIGAVSGRDDLSPFVVHLTRDDRADFTNGSTASENLNRILSEKQVMAIQSHCIYNKEIAELPDAVQKKCAVACFTEVPLSQIHRLTGGIPGRSTKLEPYGLVFRKDRLIKSGAQPAIYVNSYGENRSLREAYRQLFNAAKDDHNSKLWRIVPLLNAMHEKHDFSWEREWRMTQTFSFKTDDIVSVILPQAGEESLRDLAVRAGVSVITPGLNYEQIVMELSSQQRATKAGRTDR